MAQRRQRLGAGRRPRACGSRCAPRLVRSKRRIGGSSSTIRMRGGVAGHVGIAHREFRTAAIVVRLRAAMRAAHGLDEARRWRGRARCRRAAGRRRRRDRTCRRSARARPAGCRALRRHDDLDAARRPRRSRRPRCGRRRRVLGGVVEQLNSTCSNSTGRATASADRARGRVDRCGPSGRGAARRSALPTHVAEVDRLALGRDRAGIQPGHVEQVGDEAVEPLGLLAECRSSSSRVAVVIARRDSSCRLVSAPRIEASGVRRSCEIEVSSAERSRSGSAPQPRLGRCRRPA